MHVFIYKNRIKIEKKNFVCLTGVEGHLVELDGAYNSGPLVVEKIPEEETLLTAAVR